MNDLLAPAMALNDEIAPLLGEMADPAALLIGMSGSGSTLFSLYESEAAAKVKAAALSAPTLITRTFSPSPRESA